jgi:spore maturation protein CgeB
MRIFFASDTSPNAWFAFNSNLWRNNLLLPMLELGHDVVEFDYDLRNTFRNVDPRVPEQRVFIEKNRPIVSREVLKQIKSAHAIEPIRLFFSYFYDACILPQAIDEIKGMGIKTVNWYCNGSYQLHLVSEISPHYDWCLVPEKSRLEDYRAMGANAIYCQEAANPSIYRPYDLSKKYEVTFVGQAYGDRPGYIRRLLDNQLEPRVFGYGWERYCNDWPLNRRVAKIARRLLSREGLKAAAGRLVRPGANFKKRITSEPVGEEIRLPARIIGPVLDDLAMIQMFSRSKINLGFSSCGETHAATTRILQIRLRDFEVPMSGGFYMVEYMEELEEFYDIGKEIVCYSSADDLVDKIKYYLAHEDEREAIRAAGYKRCLRDHSWQKRFKTAFQQMGLE